MRRFRFSRRTWAAALSLVVVLVAFGLYWFQPWRLFTTTVVHDQLPVLAADVAGTVSGPPAASTPPSAQPGTAAGRSSFPAARTPSSTTQRTPSSRANTPTSSPVPQVVELAHGQLISHEHATSGTAG